MSPEDTSDDWRARRKKQRDDAYAQVIMGKPVVIVGAPGVGKTHFASELASQFELNHSIERINLIAGKDPLVNVELSLRLLRENPPREPMIVLIGEADILKREEFARVIKAFKNYKRVRSVIATSSTSLGLRGVQEINLGYPLGKVYGLREQAVIRPQEGIIKVVAPKILTFTDVLIAKLKKSPADLFKISPRQFEEVIADLLSGMGMEVELTPATRDGGKDILAYLNTPVGKLLTLVEAKQHNKNRPVGISLVRSLFGTLMDHQATTGLLVTTSRFAKPAQQFQERHKYQLELKDYEDVVSWLMKHKT